MLLKIPNYQLTEIFQPNNIKVLIIIIYSPNYLTHHTF